MFTSPPPPREARVKADVCKQEEGSPQEPDLRHLDLGLPLLQSCEK